MAVSSAGVGCFSFPHPLGQSELIGYCAPLVMALTWRHDPAAKPVALWAFERPFHGLVQRSLFASWFAWCVGVSLILMRRPA